MRKLVAVIGLPVLFALAGGLAVSWFDDAETARIERAAEEKDAAARPVEPAEKAEPRAPRPEGSTRVVPRLSSERSGLLLAGCGLDDAPVEPFDTTAAPCTVAVYTEEGGILDAARVAARPGETVDVALAVGRSGGVDEADDAMASSAEGERGAPGNASVAADAAEEPPPATERALAYWEQQLDDLHARRAETDDPRELERIDRAIGFIDERLRR